MNLTEKFLDFALLGAEWVLWLLVLLSIISVYVIIERILFFRTVVGADANVRLKLLGFLAEGDLEQAGKLTTRAEGTGARMVGAMIQNARRDKVAVEAVMNSVRSEEKIRLERNLAYLGTLGSNAPFIGLFGTVLGIIQAFHDLAKTGVNASGNQSEVVMAGISEALVATAVGLLVAIPAVVAYNVFQRRVKRTLAEADAIANGSMALIVSLPPEVDAHDEVDDPDADGKDD